MPELLDIAVQVAGAARPGEEIEAYVSWHRDTDIRAYGGQVESLSSAESAGIGVRVVVGGRQGFAYVGSLDSHLALEALAEARDNAGFASADEHVGLASPDGTAATVLELWDDALAGFPSASKVGLALELERQSREGDVRVRQVVSADYGDSMAESAVASSTGIAATSRRTRCYVATHLVAGEGEQSQTGNGYSIGRGPGELDVAAAARDAIERSTRLLGAKKARSARLDVVLDRRVTATLLAILSGALSGEEVAKGRSMFSGREHEEVAVPDITLVDDPTDPVAFGAATHDAEGLACRPNSLIEGGRLVGFLYDTYSARLAGRASTASAVRGGFKSTPGVGARALSLVPGTLNQSEILAHVDEGLLVQGISGVHSGVSTVSGDFSVGAEGLMIRNGELAEPVREVTIASSIQRMLHHVIAVGSDLEWLPSVAAGVTLAVSDVTMSGA